MTDGQRIAHTAPDELNTHQCIKLLALVLMTIDHIGAYLYPDVLWFRAVGRLCVPVWFFLVGHAPYYRVKANLILWAAVLAVLSPWLGPPFFALNTLATILLCQLALHYIEKHDMLARHPFFLCFVSVLFVVPTMLLLEYGTQGMLFALMGYAVRSGQMGWRTGKLVSMVALALYLFVQLVMLDFTLAQQLFVVVGVSGVTWYFSRFIWRPITTMVPEHVARPLVWLSRHSMQYYVVHRVGLEVLGVYLGVSPLGWQWIEV